MVSEQKENLDINRQNIIGYNGIMHKNFTIKGTLAKKCLTSQSIVAYI